MLTKQLLATLMGMAMLASCSRPVAYFQRTPTEQFHTAQATPVSTLPASPAASVVATVPTPEATATAPATVQAKQAMSQIEAYVRNDSKLASNKKLTKRMARVNELLASANEKASLTTKAGSAKKLSLMERVTLRKIDKKIKNHVAPDQTNELTKNMRNGIIIGAIGLLLALIFSGVIGVIGVVLLIVGVVLILLDVLSN